jgi:UDP-2,3-diacylglucosamine hydrolase
MDVNAGEVDRTLATHRVQRLVHGHTHRPNVHRWNVEDAAFERIVLGDWYEQGSVLRVTADQIELLAL